MNNEAIPEFGIKRENEEQRDGGCGVVFDPETGLFAVAKAHDDGRIWLFSGGLEPGEDIEQGILREVEEESGLYDFFHTEHIGQALAHYHNSLKNVNRVAHATCYLYLLKSKEVRPTKLEEHEKFSLHWATSDDIFADWNVRNQNGDVGHWLYFLEKVVKRLQEMGYLR